MPRPRVVRKLAEACAAAVALTVMSVPLGAAAQPPAEHAAFLAPQEEQSVDPLVGTAGNPPWFSGNTTPAAVRPFGMVQLGPDTTDDADTGRPSRYASGYGHDDPLVRGFSATHLSGAGCPAFGDVPVLPWTRAVSDDPASATVPMDRDQERAGPGWYRTGLDNGVRVSLAAADRAGLAVYRFPAGVRPRLLIKGAGSLAGASDVKVSAPSRRTVAVSATSGHFCGSPGEYRVHMLLRFDRPVVRRGTWTTGANTEELSGTWVAFGGAGGSVGVQVGVSFVDVAGARRNLRDATLGWSFRAARAAASRAWAVELGRVAVEGGTEAERRTFDTALYHALLHPTLLSDADGRYPGFDGTVHTVTGGRRHYTAVSGWDAYRTHLPLLAWLRPDVASDVVLSLVRAARQGGWLPKWPLVASYTGVMGGDSAAPIIAASHAFGARAFPLREAVERLARQADATGGIPGQGWYQPRPGLASYLERGYVPDVLTEGAGRSVGASTTLEYAVDDFALSRLATAVGRTRLATRMLRRSASWMNLVDAERRLLLPRDEAGSFPGSQYDPARCCLGFEEGNAVQYSWSVPHDMGRLLAALGSRSEVLDRLASFHEQLNAGAWGATAWLGNQPTLATPWAYLWLGAPWAGQDVVARARRELWSAAPDGLPGNDDLGALSAWYVWASLGLYPVIPGTAVMGIGVPAFPRFTVTPSVGAPTRIVRGGEGPHVARVEVDGAPHSATWLPFGPRQRPSRVVVRTTDEARPDWGTGVDDEPPSYPVP